MPVSYDDEKPTIPEGFEEADFEPVSFPMFRRTYNPGDARRLESWQVIFRESYCPQYFTHTYYTGADDYTLSPLVMDWLNANAEDFVVESMDRGDWGQGAPIATVDFARIDEADAFCREFDRMVNTFTYSMSGINKLKKMGRR